MKDKKFLMKNLILGLLVILLIVFPLVTIKNAEFAGADDRATQAIAEVDKIISHGLNQFGSHQAEKLKAFCLRSKLQLAQDF